MALKKVRKEVGLTQEVVALLQEKANLEKRSWKNYVEIALEKVANGKIIVMK